MAEVSQLRAQHCVVLPTFGANQKPHGSACLMGSSFPASALVPAQWAGHPILAQAALASLTPILVAVYKTETVKPTVGPCFENKPPASDSGQVAFFGSSENPLKSSETKSLFVVEYFTYIGRHSAGKGGGGGGGGGRGAVGRGEPSNDASDAGCLDDRSC